MIGYQCSPSAVRGAPVSSSTGSAGSSVAGGYHSSASSPTSSVASSSSSVSSSSSSSSSSTSSLSSSSASRSPVSPNLLDYYPEINQDGLGMSWFHQANNRARLAEALMSEYHNNNNNNNNNESLELHRAGCARDSNSNYQYETANRMIIAGDISLAEMSRYPVPIMAKPPLGVSDITLENWLQELAGSPGQRGIKLTFTSTRTVEPAFRVLARHAEHLKGPLILDADILSRPELGAGSGPGNRSKLQQQLNPQHQQPVDAWTFLMLCRTRFPTSTISIGWCAAGSSSGFQIDECASSPAGSLHSSADSMFDLNIIASQHVHLHNHHLQHHQLHQLQGHLQSHHHLSHHILSSTGSLHSSSGNSSGSPSPTSPIGHHHHHPNNHHHHQHHQHHHPHHSHQLSQLSQQLAANASPPHQVAAAMAAAVAAANSFQEMPLNLNINEASLDACGKLSTSAGPTSAIISQLQLHNASSQHVHKKAAMSSANSNAPSPQSSTTASHRRQSITTGLLKTTSSTNGSQSQLATTGNSGQPTNLTAAASASHQQQAAAGYTREMIDKMASLVKEYNLTQPVTFPVEARLLKNSLGELQRLLYQVGPNSTLTVVAKQSDLISVDELLAIRKAFATNQILFDLPDELASSLKQELNLF